MPAENGTPEYRNVVIVGGGFAGLSAAFRLALANEAQPQLPPVTYVVLEADQKALGGRASGRCDRDFGAGYVAHSQNYIQFLIRALQIKTEPTYLERTKEWLYLDDTQVQRYPGDDPLNFPGVPNALYRLGEIDAMVLEVRRRLTDPWTLPQAKLWDSLTVQDWIDQQVPLYRKGNEKVGMSPETAAIFTTSIRAAFSLEPKDISLFFMLYYAASAGSYSALVDISGGDGTAEGTRFKFGTQNAIKRLAAAVDPKNIALGQRVTRITSEGYSGAHVTTTDADGHLKTWLASKVIIAMSPATSKSIELGGLLDLHDLDARRRLSQAMESCKATTIKGFVEFKTESAWRERMGLMGYALSTADFVENPVGWTLDNTWDPIELDPQDPDNADQQGQTRHATLMTFIGGDAAKYWSKKPRPERARKVIAQLMRMFGFTEADFLDDKVLENNYEERDWVAEGIPAPDAMMPPGVLSDPRLGEALRKPLGNIHFAGSEAALEWCGYMDGAVESGFRAAAEIMSAFSISADALPQATVAPVPPPGYRGGGNPFEGPKLKAPRHESHKSNGS